MKFFSIHFLIILKIIFSAELIPPSLDANWNILQNSHVWIGWLDDGQFQWCRASSTIPASIEEVQKIIEDKENYPQVFKRIEKATVDQQGYVHIILDMPFPFYGRDYIVSYTQFREEDDTVYRFNAVKDSRISIHEDYVRLIHAGGEWRLHPLNKSSTEVTYTWNGELRGDFPNWALKRAWETQGDEVLNWLKEAVQD